MKKIYALFVMMCVVLGASANPIYCVDKKVEFSPIEKASKHYSHEAIRQALAMPNEAAKAPQTAEPLDTVSIVATDLSINEVDLDGMVFSIIEANTDEYSILFCATKYLLPGEYATESFLLSSTALYDLAADKEIKVIDIHLTVAGEGDARTIVGHALGDNNVLYNLDLSFVMPEATDTVEIVFDTPAEVEWYSSSNDHTIYNMNEEYIVFLDILADKDNLVGEFTADDFLMSFCLIGEIADSDTTMVFAMDINAVVTAVSEELVHIDAEMLGKNGTLYLISTDAQLPEYGMPLDEKTGSVDKTFTMDDHVKLSEYTGCFILDIYDSENYLGIYIVADKDEETIIPVGTYPIDYFEETGTVVASSGVNDKGQVSYSFIATINENSLLTTPIYFLVSGTVEVSVEGDKLKLEVNAVNSYDVPVHVVCEYQLELGAAVEDIMLENGGIRKVVQDNQLYIIKEGVKYDVLGVKL